jgi:hypothetical protein
MLILLNLSSSLYTQLDELTLDCGLKTRRWEEVIPSLKNMVEAAQKLRQEADTTMKEQ